MEGQPIIRKTDLVISGWGLACAAGNQPFALLGTVGSGLNLARPDPVFEAPLPGGDGTAAVLTSPVLEPDIDPAARMQALWQGALDDALAAWKQAGGNPAKARLILLVPDESTERGRWIDTTDWSSSLAAHVGETPVAGIEVWPVREGVTEAVLAALALLEAGEGEALVLGAVDSLLDPLSLEEFAADNRLLLEKGSDGFAPGEAAVFLVIEPAATAGERARARLRAIACLPEPGHGRVGETRLTGLAQAIELAATEAGAAVTGIDCLCATLGGERQKNVEWFQAGATLWPVRLDEAERLAMQNGEADAPQPAPPEEPERLDPALALGETGMAALPLSLLCACARFEFAWPAVRNALVVEMPDAPWRSAFWLEPVARESAQD